jgi:transposase
MPFVGLDLHKKIAEFVILDDSGNILCRGSSPATRAALENFARTHLTRDHRLALEATTHTWAVVALLEPFLAEVVVSNPLRTRAIAEAKIKTDRVDALVLAQLLRSDFLPRVWKPDPATRQLRQVSTERANLVADRTRLKNRIHAVLHQRLIQAPAGDLFQPASRAWLQQLELDPLGRQTLDRHLRQFRRLEEELTALTDELAVQAHADPRTRLLMTLPGVDFPVAQTLLAALGDVGRFPSADRAAAYLGLVPSTHQSAAHCYHGPITKQGNSHARWMLVQAAQSLARHPGPLGVFFRRLAKKKNRNVAVVATARKLVTIAWHMLRANQPYRYAQPATLEAKFSRLRIRATGQRKRTAPAKGTPRAAAYGTGKPTRAVPSLDQVYAAAALPALPPAAAGERRMLEENGAAVFAEQIRKPKRVPRRSA